MVEVKWTPVIVGLVIAIILGIILELFIGSWGGLIAYLIATIYVGYTVGGDYMNGAIHGATCRYSGSNNCRHTRYYWFGGCCRRRRSSGWNISSNQ